MPRDGAIEWVALPTGKPAYRRLTLDKQRAGNGQCHLNLADLLAGGQGIILIAQVRVTTTG